MRAPHRPDRTHRADRRRLSAIAAPYTRCTPITCICLVSDIPNYFSRRLPLLFSRQTFYSTPCVKRLIFPSLMLISSPIDFSLFRTTRHSTCASRMTTVSFLRSRRTQLTAYPTMFISPFLSNLFYMIARIEFYIITALYGEYRCEHAHTHSLWPIVNNWCHECCAGFSRNCKYCFDFLPPADDNSVVIMTGEARNSPDSASTSSSTGSPEPSYSEEEEQVHIDRVGYWDGNHYRWHRHTNDEE